ncbi:PRC-barrel domain-containing protein [Fodinibius sp.]|uniref:PRC-barrel domain-containing protein n=1 Tax=Fodinibius sp. TaxID=1872440 RepID=UPI00356AFF46
MQNLLNPAKNLKKPLQEEQDRSQQVEEIDALDEEIIVKLRNALASHAIGAEIQNHKGEYLGRIKKITFDDKNKLQYIIVHCTSFFGGGNRYFAIPAFSGLLELSKEGEVVLKVDKNDLKLAKGISADKCPPPNLPFGPSIYELYNYNDSTGQKPGMQQPINRKYN